MASTGGSAKKELCVDTFGSRPFCTVARSIRSGNLMPRSFGFAVVGPFEGKDLTYRDNRGSTLSVLKAPTRMNQKSAAFEKRSRKNPAMAFRSSAARRDGVTACAV